MHSNNKKLILIIADSWQREVFFDSLEEGLLPEIQKELIDGGTFFRDVVSVFPSVSLSSHASILTGSAPSDHKIPGHRWYDRKDNRCRNYIGPNCWKINDDMSKNTKTLLEIDGDNLSIQSTISRGATYVIRKATLSSNKILELSANRIRLLNPYTCVIWLPQGDHLAHAYGPASKECRREMEVTSRALGQFMNDLRKNPSGSEYDLLFVSDHGQRKVKFIYDFKKFFRKNKIPVSVNPREASASGCNLFTNGDSAAFLYFVDIAVSHDKKMELSRQLSREIGIGLVFLSVSESTHYIISKDGMARLTSCGRRVENYEIIDGLDPLGIPQTTHSAGFDYNDINYSIRWKHPDVLVQYLSSYVSGRSPDVLVTAADNYHFSPAPRIGWRFGFHRGSHGTASRDEMLTFAIFKGKNSVQKVENGPVRIWDILARIRHNINGGDVLNDFK